MHTTAATYETDLLTATRLYDASGTTIGFPDGEYEKTRNDALNNTWVEWITVQAWAAAALRRVYGE